MAEQLPCELSERELEILGLVVTGATNQQIAQRLIISVNTVKAHLRNIFGKLGVESRTEATLYAIQHNLVRVGQPEAQPQPEAAAVAVEAPAPRPAPRPIEWPFSSMQAAGARADDASWPWLWPSGPRQPPHPSPTTTRWWTSPPGPASRSM